MADLLGIGTMVASAVNAASQVATNKSNRKAQMELFDKTNAYNNPVEQVKRMKSAGLNPALMYQGSPQNTAQQIKLPESTAPQFDARAFEAIANIAKSKASTELTNEQTAQMSTKTELLQASINSTNTKIDAMLTEMAKNKAQIPLIEAQTDATKAGTANTQQNTANAVIAGQNMLKQREQMQQDLNQKNAMFPISKQAVELSNQKQRSEINRLNQEIQNFPQEQKLLFHKMSQEIINLGKDATAKDYANLFSQYENELKKLNINPNGGFLDTLMKMTTLGGESLKETVTGQKSKFNNR